MALGVKKPVLQIVGFQNSGKTTLMTKLLEKTGEHGWTVAALKHHGHGGLPLLLDGQKDSGKYRQAGALATGVEGGGRLQITVAKDNWKLEEIVELYGHFPVDLLLVEGYKQAQYPKIVLIKGEQELDLLGQLTHIQAVISWEPLSIKPSAFPVFLLSEETAYLQWFVYYMTRCLLTD
ncbi:molybdopterin-guanine dinucleotide biosynthesis protein MobB [Bacillus badius]|nr:molybdopterin-guanine dinucleotide biosynthesis protein MobB [Bacillus badius]